MSIRSARTLLVVASCCAFSLVAAGCDSAPAGGGSASAAGSAAPAAKSGSGSAAATTAAKAPEQPKVEMVDHDLSSADPKWAGWTAKGPADAKVMADGVAGARIAAKGPSILDRKPGGDEGFDIAFAWGKEDLKTQKENVKKGADSAKSTMTIIKDEAGQLEYSLKGESGNTTYYFTLHMNVEKTDVSCKNGNMMGAGNEAEHKRLMDACKTLAKKAK